MSEDRESKSWILWEVSFPFLPDLNLGSQQKRLTTRSVAGLFSDLQQVSLKETSIDQRKEKDRESSLREAESLRMRSQRVRARERERERE